MSLAAVSKAAAQSACQPLFEVTAPTGIAELQPGLADDGVERRVPVIPGTGGILNNVFTVYGPGIVRSIPSPRTSGSLCRGPFCRAYRSRDDKEGVEGLANGSSNWTAIRRGGSS